MAWKGTSRERQFAETIVSSLLSTKYRQGKKTNVFIALITLLLGVLGLLWVSDMPGEDDSENDNISTASDSVGFSYNDEQSFSEPDVVGSCLASEGRFSIPDRERVTIERCVDGDTLIVITSSGLRERVRLIGANTPETVKKDWPVEPFGPEASEYTRRRVEETGHVATLVADGNAYDRYNRRLAFVYLGDEKFSLNEDLCRQGLAKAETKYSFSKEMKSRIVLAAEVAEREGIGIYSLSQ